MRELTAEELQRFLDVHAGQPAQLLGSGWATLDPPVHPSGGPDPSGPTAAVPAEPVTGSLGSPGRSAFAYRRRRAEELAAWSRSLAWRAPLVAAAGLAGACSPPASLPRAGLVGLAVAALVGWRLRFRPSEQARTWQRGAHGERRTAHLLERLTRDGFVVFHDLAVPGNTSANVDHLVIGPSGVFVIDSKQWTGSVHQGADGLAWHNHYPLDRTLETIRWEAQVIGRLLGTGSPRCCASTAPTSTAAACTPRAWRSCPPTCSAARWAMTGCCRTPTSTCSPPPSGPASARPPDVPSRQRHGTPARRVDRRLDTGVDRLQRVA